MNTHIGCWQWRQRPLSCLPPPKLQTLHLWRFSLIQQAAAPADLEQLLSEAEQRRGARLMIPEKRRQFVVARAVLRTILGAYLDLPPTLVEIEIKDHGKPFIPSSQVQFNLSHSGDWGIIAVTTGTAVGVDLEQIANRDRLDALVEHAFNWEEKGIFSSLSRLRRRRGFYRLWTAREARLKCLGTGLAGSASDFSPVFTRFFPVAGNYLAALATDHPVQCIKRYHLNL